MKLCAITVLSLAFAVLAADQDDDAAAAADKSNMGRPVADQIASPSMQHPQAAVAKADREDEVHQFYQTLPELGQTQFQRMHPDGRYSFGYAHEDQGRAETRDQDGTVTGTYFYVDADGNKNQVFYRADETGFHVTANNLPVAVTDAQPVQDTPEVQRAREEHLRVWNAIAQHHKSSQQQAAAAAAAAATAAAPAPADVVPIAPIAAAIAADQTDKVGVVQTRPVDPDVTIDDEKESIITEKLAPGQEQEQQEPSEADEPIRLLAHLYANHLRNKNDASQPVEDEEEQQQQQQVEVIDRPQGFYPSNLPPTYASYDLFRDRNAENDRKDAVVVNNPEFVDLKTFLFTNVKSRSAESISSAEYVKLQELQQQLQQQQQQQDEIVQIPEESVAVAADPVIMSEQPADQDAKPLAGADELEETPSQIPIVSLDDLQDGDDLDSIVIKLEPESDSGSDSETMTSEKLPESADVIKIPSELLNGYHMTGTDPQPDGQLQSQSLEDQLSQQLLKFVTSALAYEQYETQKLRQLQRQYQQQQQQQQQFKNYAALAAAAAAATGEPYQRQYYVPSASAAAAAYGYYPLRSKYSPYASSYPSPSSYYYDQQPSRKSYYSARPSGAAAAAAMYGYNPYDFYFQY
jgi:hypothetical protein